MLELVESEADLGQLKNTQATDLRWYKFLKYKNFA